MGEWVPIGKAAQRLGVSADTVKRRIKRAELQAQREARPQGYRWLVELPDNAPTTVPVGEDPGAGASAGQTVAGEAAALRELVGVLREQLEARTREVSELHILLQQAHRALPSATPHQSAQEGQQTADGVEVVLDDLSRPREAPRKAWWRFW